MRAEFRVFHPREIAERIAQEYKSARGTRWRTRLVWAAGELCGPFSTAFLARCAESEDAEVRRLAASALGKAVNDLKKLSKGARNGLETTRKALERLAKDSVTQVGEYARKGLKELE